MCPFLLFYKKMIPIILHCEKAYVKITPMELKKGRWGTDGDRLSLSMPICKVDKENRLVSGWATLDNVDQADDVMLASASKIAFERFRGNIREMHEPIAAGKLVNFKEESFYDKETNKFYTGTFVTVYVSKGAQSTWEKVLDGTLSGFSVGGVINDSEVQFVKDAGDGGKTVRFVKDYDLVELSLVDSPCNQLANVFSIEKSATGNLMKGMVVDTNLVNVFWCDEDEIAKNSNEENETCFTCDANMKLIGWYEKGEDEAVKVASIVEKFLRQKEGDNVVSKQHNDANGEGGVDMTDEIKNDEQDVVSVEEVATEEVETEETEGTESPVAEETAEVSEVDAEPDFEKMFDSLRDSVTKSLEGHKESIEKDVKEVQANVSEIAKTFDAKSSELEKGLSELREGLGKVTELKDSLEKRLEIVEKSTALKKSGEVESEPTERTLQKGLWGNTFFD